MNNSNFATGLLTFTLLTGAMEASGAKDSQSQSWPARPLALQNTGNTIDLGAGGPPASAAKGQFQPASNDALPGSIFIYCAAALKEPIGEIARQFEKNTGVKVEMTVANSGQLLGQIQTTHIGDIYIPAEMDFAAQAAKNKLTRGKLLEFGQLRPVILVKKGNPKAIHGLTDLTRPGLKLALADASAAIGKVQRQLFKKNNLDVKTILRNTLTTPAMVTDVALAVKLGTVDAGLVWDAVGAQHGDTTEMVLIPADKNIVSRVAACTLSGSRNPKAAQAFLDYLVSEAAQQVLHTKGFGGPR